MLSRPFLTVKQVADLFSVGEVTVRHWIKDGELRAIDVGREWRIAPRDLEQFVEHRATRQSQQDGRPPKGGDSVPNAHRQQRPE